MTRHETASRGRRSRALWPHVVILARVGLAFVVVGLFSQPHPLAALGVGLTVVVVAMDALDGYLARRLGVVSKAGAVLDIAGDRIVEHVFWIYFAVAGHVPLWVPVVIVTRSFAVDGVRTLALSLGRTPFGPRTMQRSALTRFLVASRLMRNLYGLAKVLAFVLLGAALVVAKAEIAGAFVGAAGAWISVAAQWVVLLTVALCLARGVPVLWDARHYARTEAPS